MSRLTSFSFTREAFADYEEIKARDPKMAQKIKDLILNIMETPYSGLGKPETLRFELSGCWSRRITQQHRLVYRIVDNSLQVLSCRYHYK